MKKPARLFTARGDKWFEVNQNDPGKLWEDSLNWGIEWETSEGEEYYPVAFAFVYRKKWKTK
jgi:hypothetical protein